MHVLCIKCIKSLSFKGRTTSKQWAFIARENYLKVAVHLIFNTHATCVLLITIYNFSDLHNSMGKIIHEASVAAISTVEQ